MLINILFLTGREEEILLIHDSFVTHEEKEIFLCRGNKFDRRWFAEYDLPKDKLENYRSIRKASLEPQLCNTDKSSQFACEMKCRTRGLALLCTNCGIIIAYKELFGSESCTQIALMYLEVRSHYMSKLFVSICYYKHDLLRNFFY